MGISQWFNRTIKSTKNIFQTLMCPSDFFELCVTSCCSEIDKEKLSCKVATPIYLVKTANAAIACPVSAVACCFFATIAHPCIPKDAPEAQTMELEPNIYVQLAGSPNT